ncbi:MAG: ABC-F family ATP-binding cassette domain-containing protein [Lachnospiraceae bacterium]|nr:ABC-F family ATP-binding cassette domain-containing protein [Lachnospiraceae bacterium]
MILSCNNISKAFVENTVLKNISFHVEDRDRAAIIGNNGAGKSTLLKIIMKELAPDEGEVIISKNKTIGYLAQHQNLLGNQSIYEELLSVKEDIINLEKRMRSIEETMKHVGGDELSDLMDTYTRLTHEFELKNGYAYKSEIVGVLKGLGFDENDFSKQTDKLSGGQKTRVALGKLLLTKPDIILLDEPTNHLDMESIMWLENYLLNYDGCVIIVAHDRYFLDKIVTKVIEIENASALVYNGNYTDFAQKKAMLRDAQLKQYYNQQREIKHQEEVIAKLRSFNREKSIKRAESREKMLNKIEVIEKPMEYQASMRFTLEPRVVSGNDVLSVKELKKSFNSLLLFKDLNFEIKRGERVAIIGKNGTGKTTILKIINGILEADNGIIKLGSKVQIGYYDQEHNVLNMDKTVFDEISDEYPTLTNTEIRNVLAAFLFTNDDVFKRIGDLSGGERGRVSLAKLMLSEANFLILDEPTNHLDIASKEILEQALASYTGTVLFVSHDRYFINKTATRILDLYNSNLVNYIGNYDYYLEKREELSAVASSAQNTVFTKAIANTTASVQSESSKSDWQAQKEEQARLRKINNDIKKLEDAIEKLEKRNEEIDELLTHEDIFTDVAKLMELNNEKSEVETQLEELFEKWSELNE